MATKKPIKKSISDFDARLKTYVRKEEELLDSLYISRRIILNFPKRKNKRPSFFGRLGIFFVTASGGVIDTEFTDLKSKK